MPAGTNELCKEMQISSQWSILGRMERVMERAAAGDPDALGELWRAHQHLLLRYFRGKGMAEPEDLASIVWLEVARNLRSFEGGMVEFRRWLFTIAARRRVDEIRRARPRRWRSLNRRTRLGKRLSRR